MGFLNEYWRIGLGAVVIVLVSWRLSRKLLTLGLKRPPDTLRSTPPVVFADALPEFAVELAELLSEEGKPELAAQIGELVLVDRCRCTDDFCSTFYVRPKPLGSYGPNHYTVVLSPKNGMVNVDVTEGKVACIEVLYRDDIQARLHAVMP
jgi:hypothetical protein